MQHGRVQCVIEHRVERHLPYAVRIQDSGVHVSVRLCVCPSVRLSVCLSVTITVRVCLPVCLFRLIVTGAVAVTVVQGRRVVHVVVC